MAKKKYIRKSIRIGGKPQSKLFPNSRLGKEAAEDWYNQKKRDKAARSVNGGLLSNDDTTFKKMSIPYLQYKKQKKVTYSTMLNSIGYLRDHLIPVIGDRVFTEINSKEFDELIEGLKQKTKEEVALEREILKCNEDINLREKLRADLYRAREERKEPLSESTKNKVRAELHHFYEYAIKNGYAFFNPIRATKKYQEPDPRFNTQFISKEEDCQNYLFEAKKEGAGYFTYAVIAINWGNRVAEILGLQVKDVDWIAEQIPVYKQFSQRENKLVDRLKEDRPNRPKKSKVIPLTGAIRAAVEYRFKTKPNEPESFLVNRDETGTLPLRYERIRAIHYVVCARAGIKNLSPHGLRHTFGAHFTMKGGNLGDLSFILGHGNASTTHRYRHLSPEYLKGKANLVQFSDAEITKKETQND